MPDLTQEQIREIVAQMTSNDERNHPLREARHQSEIATRLFLESAEYIERTYANAPRHDNDGPNRVQIGGRLENGRFIREYVNATPEDAALHNRILAEYHAAGTRFFDAKDARITAIRPGTNDADRIRISVAVSLYFDRNPISTPDRNADRPQPQASNTPSLKQIAFTHTDEITPPHGTPLGKGKTELS